MDDAGAVSCRKCTGNLDRDIEHFAELQRRVSHALAQCIAIDKFSGYEVDRIGLVNLMDGDDVGMVERGSSLGFPHKALHSIRMSSNIGRQNLQCNFAIEFRILRQIHLTHPARAELRANFVTTEFCACGDGHSCGRPAK